MNTRSTVTTASEPDLAEMRRELAYLRALAEHSAAKILELDRVATGFRHELEQKRRGFSLMAELALTLNTAAGDEEVFISASRRVNAALNMQRTAVLAPAGGDVFRASVLQGYSVEDENALKQMSVTVPPELLDMQRAVVVTGEDPEGRLAEFRKALKLPFFISSTVVLNGEVTALLVTGRLVEQLPWMPRLGKSDVETVQTVGAYLAAILSGQRLMEAEERTRIMFDATPLCCNLWDQEYRNTACNAEAPKLFGLGSKEEYLARFFELSPRFQPNGRLSVEYGKEKVDEAFKTGHLRFEWLHCKPSGERVPAEITLVRVKHGDSHIVAGYTRDLRETKAILAEIRKTEDELRLARDVAEKNARAKSDFLANMSHEIRTPMNAILGMAHLLGKTEMSEKQRMYVEKVEHSASLLLHIINDILDFSKIDAGHMEMESLAFSLRKTIQTAREIIITQAAQKGLTLSVDVDPDVPDAVIGDAMRLEQILLNLLSNSVKFTETGGISLRVATKESSPDAVTLLFTLRDTGIGMTAAQIEGLFTPFTQADTSTTRKYGGTGLGLAISKSLVTMMGGTIWCESRPGEGSTFFFTVSLPLSREQRAEEGGHTDAAANDRDEEFGAIAGMRVLLAEDNEINQMIAEELLRAKGVAVTMVETGHAALEALEEDSYDLVLMDIQMPEMDGLTATKHIRANPRYADLPIIAMTAHAMAGDREISLEVGMNDHLTKPIDPYLLYAMLQRWKKKPQP